MAEGGSDAKSDRKLRSHTEAKPGTPVTPSPSTRQRLAGFVREGLRETSEEENHAKFARLGLSLGLEGGALAEFVLKKEAQEKELQLRKESEEKVLQLKIEAQEKELQFREKEFMLKNEAQKEELKMKREAHEEKMRASKRTEDREEEQKHLQDVHMDPLRDGEDVDAYITHFERIAVLCHWKRTVWSTRLVALLRGKPREAVLRLQPEDLTDYEKVKTALLGHFRLDAEAYHQRFRTMRKEPDETFEQLLIRLRSCLKMWCQAANKDSGNADDLLDLFLQEQLYRFLAPDYIVEVRRASPETADDVARQATILAEARRMGRAAKKDRREEREEGSAGDSDTAKGKGLDEPEAEVRKGTPRSENSSSGQRPPRLREMTVCYRCGQRGHVAQQCSNSPKVAAVVPSCEMELEPATPPSLCATCAVKPYTPRCQVTVNGVPANGVRDTGAGYTVVASKLVPLSDYTGDSVLVTLAESSCQIRLPVAFVHLRSPFLNGRIRVLVMKQPVEEVLVGNYVQRFENATLERVPVYAVSTQVAAVQTRSQVKQQAQLRPPLSLKDRTLGVDPETLREAQDTDISLEGPREACREGTVLQTKLGTVTYTRKGGVLVRKFSHPFGNATQVCVPQQLRATALALAHDVPGLGHLSVRKTKARLFPHFYWPGMCSDISRYCQSCKRCKRSLIREPFDRGRSRRRPHVKRRCYGFNKIRYVPVYRLPVPNKSRLYE